MKSATRQIDADLRDPRQVGRTHGDEALDERARDEHAERAADDGQHGGLGDQLNDDASARGTDGGAHRELAPPGCAPHEEEVRDVGAGDQQHERDGGEEHAQHRRRATADLFVQRLHQHPGVRAVRLGVGRSQPA